MNNIRIPEVEISEAVPSDEKVERVMFAWRLACLFSKRDGKDWLSSCRHGASSIVPSQAPFLLALTPVASSAPSPCSWKRVGAKRWGVVFDNQQLEVGKQRGMEIIGTLLSRPDCVVSPNDLRPCGELHSGRAWLGGELSSSRDVESPGMEAFDERTRVAVQTMMEKLSTEADLEPNPERKLILGEEVKQLQDYLSKGLDIRGRPRVLKNPAKKAKDASAIAINRTIDQIQQQHRGLADYLRSTIKRKNGGFVFCPQGGETWDVVL